MNEDCTQLELRLDTICVNCDRPIRWFNDKWFGVERPNAGQWLHSDGWGIYALCVGFGGSLDYRADPGHHHD